ncbi:hypothetical protein [Candidatus Nitrososphaera evergladensis]|uniref:hypothetical protein n=1 Tax=Candidatus Nitrososphaera evergladensis TaxID=1459637 RepID=UPI0011E5E6A2|nr:hypothetical protein [Candidatus Nitrososphaera evergladensis]
MQYDELCNRILELESSIRFVALADHLGLLIATVYRKGLVPLATKDETAKYAGQLVLLTGAVSGGKFMSKVGKMQYVVGKFENLVRATIPIVSDDYDKYYLLMSLDVDSDYVHVIDRVLAFLRENHSAF